MLPGSTDTRTEREAARGRPSGRTQEIQRLIGRSLRAVTDMEAVGERCFWVDCDVLQADGGTRTAAITGAYVALAAACRRLVERGNLRQDPLRDSVAAVSVGIVGGEILLDLGYDEDSRAEVDLNLVMTGRGRMVEVQGTGESGTFDRDDLNRMLDLGAKGIAELTRIQAKALDG
jgi:ribonuclease PH